MIITHAKIQIQILLTLLTEDVSEALEDRFVPELADRFRASSASA